MLAAFVSVDEHYYLTLANAGEESDLSPDPPLDETPVDGEEPVEGEEPGSPASPTSAEPRGAGSATPGRSDCPTRESLPQG